MVITNLMTAEDLAAMRDDGYRYELVRGELRRMPPPGWEHAEVLGEVVLELGAQIRTYLRLDGQARVFVGDPGILFERDPDTVLAPDIAVVRAERLGPRRERRGYVQLVPDLVVEIVSPSDRMSQVAKKVTAYLEFGVGVVWLVEPARQQIMIYHGDGSTQVLGIEDELDGGDVLPGFRLPLRDLFPED